MPKRMPTFTFRLPLMMSRKLRALAKVYDAPVGEFVRDLIEGTIEGGLHKKLFDKRLKDGMERYKDKPVVLRGPDGGMWSAPERK